MAQYIYERSIKTNSCLIDGSFYCILFIKLCKKSNVNIIEWYLHNFEEFIELYDTKYLILSISVFYYSFDKAREKGTLINMGE